MPHVFKEDREAFNALQRKRGRPRLNRRSRASDADWEVFLKEKENALHS